MNPASSVQVGEQPSPAAVLPSSQGSPVSTLPLPHEVVHACVAPPALRHDGSLVQVFEQPLASPKNAPFGPLQPFGRPVLLVPQSQASVPSLTPLPHAALVQTLGVPVQVAPGSTWQIDEHPSPAVVLPSSHVSPPTRMPSPHRGTHGRPGTRHAYPVSTLRQSDAQPSPLWVFPSSQTSRVESTVSPQTAV